MLKQALTVVLVHAVDFDLALLVKARFCLVGVSIVLQSKCNLSKARLCLRTLENFYHVLLAINKELSQSYRVHLVTWRFQPFESDLTVVSEGDYLEFSVHLNVLNQIAHRLTRPQNLIAYHAPKLGWLWDLGAKCINLTG